MHQDFYDTNRDDIPSAGFPHVQPSETDGFAFPAEPEQERQPEPIDDFQVFPPSPEEDMGEPTATIIPLFPTSPYQPVMTQEKRPREKRKFTFAQLLASILATALLCGIVVTGVMDRRMEDRLQQLTTTAESGGTLEEQEGAVTKLVYAKGEENGISAAAQKLAKSVVGIRVTGPSSTGFFGNSSSSGEGSGVIYTADGYIITNYHVISLAVPSSSSRNNYYPFFGEEQQQSNSSSTIEVYLGEDNQTAYPATLVGYDASVDLAVLKIEKTGLTPVEITDSDALKIGDMAIAVGNPGGLEFMGSVSKGIVSGLNRTITTEDGSQMKLIQTDAAINPGNSGGALGDEYGRLIGINNAKMAGDGFEGMGFSIPANTVVEVCNRMIENQNKPQPYLGISASSEYSPEVLRRYGLPAGVLVAGTVSGSPAEAAGIQQYDIITEVNGVALSSYDQLNNEKNKLQPGDVMELTVFRGGDYFKVSVTLGVTHA